MDNRAEGATKPSHGKVTVTVADDHVSQTDAVAEALRAAGMDVDQVLGAIGIITGSVPAAHRSSIETLAGVAGVEDEKTFQLAPPDAEVQ